MADERARAARAAAAADEEFSAEFLNAAREVFIMSARGVRHSTSNLRASRSARAPSTRLVDTARATNVLCSSSKQDIYSGQN